MEKDKPALSTKIKKQDLDFVDDCQTAILQSTTPFASLFLYFLGAFLLIGLFWAHFSILDEVTSAEGKVIPPSQIKIIQNLDGGILSKINVIEGQEVKKDQVLASLDDTRYASSFREHQAKYVALLATVARLNAELAGSAKITFPKELDDHADVKEHEIAYFNSQKTSLDESLKVLTRSYELAKKELEMTEPLVNQGVISKIELLRLQRQVNEIKGQLSDKENKFKTEANTELVKAKADLAGVTEALSSQNDRVQKTTIRSPVDGTVKKININTIGGVIQPGMDIMEIVPVEDFLIVEAKVKPKDIGFIKIGQTAKVKFTAYDYGIYGGLEGNVTYISADTILDDDKKTQYYKVEVRTTKNHLGIVSHPLPIKVGMMTSVDIITGRKSVLDYLLKPFLKAQQAALRER